MIKIITINGVQRSYLGDPIGTYVCTTTVTGNKSYGGRSNLNSSNSGPHQCVNDILAAFDWQNIWKYGKNENEVRHYGYVLDYENNVLYYDNEEMFDDLDLNKFMDWELKLMKRVKIEGSWDGDEFRKIIRIPKREDFEAILERKKQGIDCTEEESAIIKMIFKEISHYFNAEAGEAMEDFANYELELSSRNKK